MDGRLRPRFPFCEKPTFIGYDGSGRPQFDTIRTPLGELLYQLKYRADAAAVETIAEAATEFLTKTWGVKADLIVPVPPSDTARLRQPVLEVAHAISKRTGVPIGQNSIKKIKVTPQLKNVYDRSERMKLLQDAFAADHESTAQKSVLLLDDLYRSGATMNSIADSFLAQGQAHAVFALCLTKTRSNL